RQIAEAYETLSDPDRRRRYDIVGPPAETPEAQVFGFEGFDFTVSVGGHEASTFGDLFGDIFQPRATAVGTERGVDLHHAITLGFEQASRGGQQSVTVTRQEHCRTCKGVGHLSTAETRCSLCQGTGVVKSARGHMVFSRACTNCGGSGRLAQAPCPTCRGQQVEMRTESLLVNVPAGLADGARIRVPGKGHAAANGGAYGDLYLSVHVEAHPLFRREGDDVHVSVPIAIHEAALGAKIDVPALDGTARVRVPPGTQSGQRF